MKFQFFVLSIFFICATGCYEPGYGTPQQQTNQPGNQGKTISPNDKSWLFDSDGEFLLFNPNLLDNEPCAILLEWSGPNTSSGGHGLIGALTSEGYAWRTWPAGSRRFYVAKSATGCSGSYGEAKQTGSVYIGYQIGTSQLSLMTSPARRWIWCDWSGCQTGAWPCGCDGKANFLDDYWVPDGNQ